MTSPYACARCRERLPWYAAGTLPLSERAEVDEHLAGCAACRRELALWRAVGAALTSEMGATAETATEAVAAHEDGEYVTWRGVQSRIAAGGQASASGLRERFLMDDEIAPVTAAVPATQSRRGSARLAARQPLMALIAAALLIALSATLFGVYGLRARLGGASSATPRSAECAPSQVTARLPENAQLTDLSMVSATDGWAVGGIFVTHVLNSLQSQTTPARTLMLRFQHCAWSVVGQGIPSATLMNISMMSANDGWAVGVTESPDESDPWAADHLILLHYTGGAWQRVRLNDSHKFQGGLLRMVSKDDGWLLLFSGRADTPFLYHYQGSDWTPVALPPQLRAANITVVSASAPDDVWLAGALGSTSSHTSFIAHYSAGQWQVWGASGADGINSTGVAIRFTSAIRVISPQDVWAFDTYTYQGSNGENSAPYVIHYDGARWTSVPVASLGDPPPYLAAWTATMLQPDGSVLALGTLNIPNGVPTDVSKFQRVAMLRCTAQGCQPQTFSLMKILSVDSLSLYSPTQGFAVAQDLSWQPSDSPGISSVLLTYNAGVWARVPD